MSHYRTCMCPVYFRIPAHGTEKQGSKPQLQPLTFISRKNDHHYLLDEILDLRHGRGFPIAEDLGPSVQKECRGQSQIMLLSGPAGIGKSTFALELCCRMVADGIRSAAPNGANKGGVCALYISSEENAKRLITKTEEYGWRDGLVKAVNEHQRTRIVFEYDAPYDVAVPPNCVLIKDTMADKKAEGPSELFGRIAGQWERKMEEFRRNNENFSPLSILVIDSLNVLAPDAGTEKKSEVFAAIKERICNPANPGPNPDLVIIVLDASRADEHSRYWEYVSDSVFRFDWDRSQDYALRTFEVIKIRGQSHILGPQRMKICGEQRMNESPYIREGGILIFPSIHWYLSRLQDGYDISQQPNSPQVLKLPGDLDSLNRQISQNPHFGGFPTPGCTAIEGNRGSMKSHLAYLFLLHQAAKAGKNCLLVSLRDDENGVRTTMRQIAEGQQWPDVDVDSLVETEDKIEIIYNEVGNISPEEFFYRIYVASVRKRKDGNRAQVVVINELDELNNRFPLIAAELMFVPGLIRMLKKLGLCVVTASATGEDSLPSVSEGLHGLNPMADLLLRFERVNKHGSSDDLKKLDQAPANVKQSKQISRVETIRVPAGQVGGQIGFFYRCNNASGKVGYEQGI